MAWTVNLTTEASEFIAGLEPDERAEVIAKMKLLREFGPALDRPHSGTLDDKSSPKSQRLSKLKELRIKFERKQFRIIYVFDTQQNAVLLVGGDKVPMGGKRWYPKYIKMAKELLKQHEAGLKASQAGGSRKVVPRGSRERRGR